MGRPKKYEINEKYFSKIDSKEKGYILGFLYADGSVNKKTFNIIIKKDDIEILKFIQNRLESTHPITIKNNYCRYSISNKKICDDLINKCNILPNKTYNIKKTPLDIIPKKYITSFLLGFFDGDGSISGKNEQLITFSSNKYFLIKIKNIFKQWNINAHLRPRYSKEHIFSYMLEFKGSQQITRFYSYLYKNSSFSLKRKKEKFSFSLEKSKKYQLTNYKENGIWEKIKKLSDLEKTQKEISVILKIPYSSVRGCVQRMRKEGKII